VLNTDSDITIQKNNPKIHLYASTGNPGIELYEGETNTMSVQYSSSYDRFQIYDRIGSKYLLTLNPDGLLNIFQNGSNAGLKIGSDCNLYRSEPNVLKSDDNFAALAVLGTNGLFARNAFGDKVNNAPWYGIGYSNVASAAGYYTQVAGYYGLKFKTANGDINMTTTGQLQLPTTGSSGGIVFYDVSLYREQYINALNTNASYFNVAGGIKAHQLKIEVPDWDDIIMYGIAGMQTGDDPVLYLSNASLVTDNDVLVYGSITSTTDFASGKQSGGGALVISHGWKGSGTQENPIALSPPLVELITSGTQIKSGSSLPDEEDMTDQAGQIFTTLAKTYCICGMVQVGMHIRATLQVTMTLCS
jgi:hypothetical protein